MTEKEKQIYQQMLQKEDRDKQLQANLESKTAWERYQIEQEIKREKNTDAVMTANTVVFLLICFILLNVILLILLHCI